MQLLFHYTNKKGTEHSAGFDLHSAEKASIPANSLKIIKTHIAFKKSRRGTLEKFMPGQA